MSIKMVNYFANKIGLLKTLPRSLWIIVFIGFGLRIWGIWYGLPLPLNIDEPTTISTVLNLQQNLNPGHFDWPHFNYYFPF